MFSKLSLRYYLVIIILFCFSLRISSKPVDVIEDTGLFNDPEVFLTIRAIAGVQNGLLLDRRLELNWFNLPLTTNTIKSESSSDEDFTLYNTTINGWIGLFNYDPNPTTTTTNNNQQQNNAKHYENSLFKIESLEATNGNVDSPIQFERIEYSKNNVDVTFNNNNNNNALEGNCVGYWIAYFEELNSTQPLISNCLKLYPNWMNQLSHEIGVRALSSIMIPGTHNAGAWKHYAGLVDDLNAFTQYTYNQEDTIYSQLLHGIRYLDVRVGYQSTTPEKFWIYHSLKIRPLESLLTELKSFVNQTNEIVIMDFHRFVEGFDDTSIHEELIQFVLEFIGDELITKSVVGPNPIINDIWATNKNIMWTYANDEMGNEHDFIWPYLTHAWGDKNDVAELHDYLEFEAIPTYGCRNRLWSSMAELTPSTEDIILRPLFGLRKFAQLVNIPLTDWYRSPAWYSKSNIVSTDYYLGNNIIEMAIKVNKNKASCS